MQTIDVGSSATVAVPALRLAMLGMAPGNGHPFSWSAIINGFDPDELTKCPYPLIKDYLGSHPDARVEGAAVTHIWGESPDVAKAARLAFIPNVVDNPTDVLGEVDAVIIPVDDGDGHVERARPFLEAGLPVLIDKPLATNAPDLRTFIQWHREGARFISSSGLRYSPELESLKDFDWSLLTGVVCNTWKRYGIHVLEPAYCLAGPGFASVRSVEEGVNQFVHLRHDSGRTVSLSVLRDASGCFAKFHAFAVKGHRPFALEDTYTAFRRQLVAFVDFATTGREVIPFSDTVELMIILLAGMESSRQGGVEINLRDFAKSLNL